MNPGPFGSSFHGAARFEAPWRGLGRHECRPGPHGLRAGRRADFREALEFLGPDAVLNFPPDHWHALISLAANQTNLPLNAPTFSGNHREAERDGSIRIKPGRVACEFVSPVLMGGAGVGNLLDFVDWANAIGANVNGSCGGHIPRMDRNQTPVPADMQALVMERLKPTSPVPHFSPFFSSGWQNTPGH